MKYKYLHTSIPLGIARSVDDESARLYLACRRYATLAFMLLFAFSGKAQTLRGDVNTADYPNVSFTWNEYNPQKLDSEQFILRADSGKIATRVENLPFGDSVPQAKSILFLWEDLNHQSHEGQSKFVQSVLNQFFGDSTLNSADRFNIAVFDRKGGNDIGHSIHTWLASDFTSNRQQLAEAVAVFRPKYDLFSNQQNSELYFAIEEGIVRLEKEPSDRVRAIVVFTAGSNLDNYGGRNSIDEARAVSLKIPVYVVKYPIRGCEHCTNIDLISQKTYGQQIATANTLIATDLLQQCYRGMSARHHGQDYRIAFTAPFCRDGQQHSIVLTVGGKEYSISFTAPELTFSMWLKENLLWATLIGISTLIIIALTAFFIVRAIKKHRRKLIELEIRQQTAAQKAEDSRKEFEQYRQQKDEEETLAKKREKEKRFAEQMRVKNLLPRLQYELSGARYSFSVIKPEIIIGRDADNDLVLVNDSVSRHHAKIVFNGNSFEIQDLGSTNKVIVNGAFTERSTLKNGDIIGLGEVIIYFSV
jgi:hypothetical protein